MAQEELGELRESLLRNLRVQLGHHDGDLAFERHILLAVRFHRAAGLNQTVTGEQAGWVQFFEEHFPKRAEWLPADAKLLFRKWRIGLVKHEAPLSGVTVTHGQPVAHWFREPDGTLCIDLESMWDDFAQAVASFIRLLERDEHRREEALDRWRKRGWTVRKLSIDSGKGHDHGWVTIHPALGGAISATASSGVPTGMSGPHSPPKSVA